MIDDTDTPLSPATTSAAIVISRRGLKNTSQSCCYAIALAAIIPRKRTGLDDNIIHNLTYYSFLDDKHSFHNLDSLLTRLSPLSVVHISCTESADPPKSKSASSVQRHKEINDLLNRLATLCDTHPAPSHLTNLSHVVNNLPKSSSDSLSSNLSTLLTNTSFVSYRNSHLDDLSKTALSFLLHETDTHSLKPPLSFQQSHISSHLSLSRTAVESINLLPPRVALGARSGGAPPNASLYQILDGTKTKMGSGLLNVWCRQPLIQLDEINRRLDVVQTLVDDGSGREKVRDALAGIIDLDGVCARLIKVKSQSVKVLECFYKIYMFANSGLPALLEAIEGMTQSNDNAVFSNAMNGLTDVYVNLEKLKGLVVAVLDMDLAPREYFIRKDFDVELTELKRELDQNDVDLENTLQKMNQEWSEVTGDTVGSVRLETETDKSWQFRLPNANAEKKLRNHFGHIRVHKILKNGVYFSTKELRELSASKAHLTKQYETKQSGVVDDAVQVVETYLPLLEKASQIIAELDVLQGFAHVAAYSPNGYVRPEMTDGDEDELGIKLEGARHPCIELQDEISFIPNDHELLFGSSSFLIITGPNMGGKSTYIRSLAAIVTMAQMGSFVPCTSAQINIVHSILARVGAGDAQQKGISTFMAEMLEASSILSQSNKRSLVIIDELGRGTSTFDGFGLAQAISEYLIENTKCLVVFATHFHELTALEKKYTCVKNRHVTACTSPNNQLTFMYEVQPGPCLESFGIQVAQMANVPEAVIEEARKKAKELECWKINDSRNHIGDSGHGKENEGDNFLQNFANLDIQSMGDEERLNAVRALLA
eukprot:CAMPEP_0172488912 /NCGR_PEP_ID=MMETSP1066-20121228/18624_1 /TAXON_ID=671091 /ORGANISM="Coscinodiscus wailesii, Strain CCMP2513" /LENGTH=824 /DNA_ID=CAMNT_0013256417 /DNA_START=47 /DNA_END=2521 /DNA_ORIENTATION=+